MLVNIYILGLILKGKFTAIFILCQTGLNQSLPVFLWSLIHKNWKTRPKKRPDCSPGPVQSWSLTGPRTGPSNTIKIVNLLSSKAEMGSPMICMYLLGNPDHYTSHTFVPFYWKSFVIQVWQDFDVDEQEVQKITLIKIDLEGVCLYDWVQQFQHQKV